MTPTENLMREHSVINDLLTIMSTIAERIKSKSVFFTNDVEEIIDFLKNFIEKSHHEKEEFLFPILVNNPISIEKEAINLMFYEHVLTRNYLKDIINCILNCKIGYTFSGDMLAESMSNYVILEKNHIQKEINIFFPIADEYILEEEQKKISERFVEIENLIEEHDFYNHYFRLMTELKNKYQN